MTDTVVYQLADHATCRSTNTNLKMLFDRARGVMYELNETASSVVAIIDEKPRDVQSIVDALMCTFDGPEDEVRADVDAFLSDFVGAGLLVGKPTEAVPASSATHAKDAKQEGD